MQAELRKWRATFEVSWTNHLAYRLNFILLVFGPALVFFFIKYNLWKSIYSMPGITVLQGYDFDQMLQYQLLVLIVSLMAQGHNSMKLADDIRLGRISSYLIYPFSFFKFHTASFLAFQGIQVLICGFTISFLMIIPLVSFSDFNSVMRGLYFASLVSFLWFQLQFLVGLLAFWLEETWILRVILMTTAQFLSGAILPLEFYPQSFVKFLDYTPFPYLTYIPIKIFQGDSINLLNASLVLLFWSLFVYAINHILFKRGVRLYTAAGM